jgi:hypothetical protein
MFGRILPPTPTSPSVFSKQAQVRVKGNAICEPENDYRVHHLNDQERDICMEARGVNVLRFRNSRLRRTAGVLPTNDLATVDDFRGLLPFYSHFPLTPALSLGERENRSTAFVDPGRTSLALGYHLSGHRPRWRSLTPAQSGSGPRRGSFGRQHQRQGRRRRRRRQRKTSGRP